MATRLGSSSFQTLYFEDCRRIKPEKIVKGVQLDGRKTMCCGNRDDGADPCCFQAAVDAPQSLKSSFMAGYGLEGSCSQNAADMFCSAFAPLAMVFRAVGVNGRRCLPCEPQGSEKCSGNQQERDYAGGHSFRSQAMAFFQALQLSDCIGGNPGWRFHRYLRCNRSAAPGRRPCL